MSTTSREIRDFGAPKSLTWAAANPDGTFSVECYEDGCWHIPEISNWPTWRSARASVMAHRHEHKIDAERELMRGVPCPTCGGPRSPLPVVFAPLHSVGEV